MAITVEARTEIISLVVGMFGAAPGASVLTDLVAAKEAGSSLKQIATNVANTAEFASIYPSFLTNGEFATKVVNNLLTEASVAAKAEAVTVLTSALNGGMSRVDGLMAAIKFVGETAHSNTEYGSSAAAFDNKVAVATFYSVDQQKSGASLLELQTVVAGVNSSQASVDMAKENISNSVTVDSTFALTINQDSIVGTGGNDLFNALATQDGAGNLIDTLQGVDTIDGGAGNDRLDVTLSQGNTRAPSIMNVETIDVRFTNNDTLDLSNSSGINTINVQNSTGTGNVNGVGAVANLNVKNQSQDVFFDDNTAAAINLGLDNVTGGADIEIDNTVATLNVTANKVNVDLDTTGVTSLSVAATGANTFALSGANTSATTATVTGAGSVNFTTAFTALKTLAAAANTGGVTATVNAAATKVDTGSAKDSITYTAALAATAKVDLGAGDDMFKIAGISGTGSKVNAGDGNDTLAVSDGSWLNAAAAAVYSGFETLDISGGTGTYDMDSLPGLTAVTLKGVALAGATAITDAVAGTTVTLTAAKAVDLAVGTLSYALKTATGTSDAAMFTLNATDGDNDATAEGQLTVAALTANGIETLNFASNVSGIDTGLANTSYVNVLTAVTATEAKTIVITGNAGLTFTALTAVALSKIDAGASTGKISVDASAATQAVQFIGGSAADTYTGTVQGDTVNAGMGADVINLDGTFVAIDTIIINAGGSVLKAGANGHDVINDFGTAGGGTLDVIDVGSFGFSGTQSSSLASKGVLAATVVNGTVLTQADFFSSAGVDRGVAIGTVGADTYVFIDANKDGDFNAADDVMIQLAGVTDVTLSNFGY